MLNNFYINNEVLYDNELENLIDIIIEYLMDTNLMDTESSKDSSEIKSDGRQPYNDFFNFSPEQSMIYTGGNKGTKRNKGIKRNKTPAKKTKKTKTPAKKTKRKNKFRRQRKNKNKTRR